MITVALLNTFIVTIASFFFIAIGAKIKSLLPLERFDSPYFQVAVQFFIGCTLFTFVWLLISLIFESVTIGLYSTTVILLLHLLYKPVAILSTTRRTIFIIIGIVLLVQAIGFARTFDPMPLYLREQPELANPFLGFGGVVHSFRAGNITQFIIENDRFPILEQHTFQGIIASISSPSQFHSTQLSLVIWLNMFIAFSVLLFFGFLRLFLNRRHALYATLVVILGNTLLSPFYSSITDAERPTLRASSYEALFGMATLLIATLVVYYTLKKLPDKSGHTNYTILFILGIIWNISSGQMIIVLLLVLGITTLYYRLRKTETVMLIKMTSILCLGAVIGAYTFGGMFSSGNKSEIAQIPGTLSVTIEGSAPITFRFPRTSESGVRAPSEIQRIINELRLPPAERGKTVVVPAIDTIVNTPSNTSQMTLTQKVKGHPITFGVAKIVRSVQVVFFCLLGILLAWLLIRKDMIPKPHTEIFQYTTLITATTFLFGWILSTIFIVYETYHWELSRFLHFGALMSMLILALSGAILYRSQNAIKKIVIFCFFAFIILGPSIELVLRIAGDFILSPEMRPEMTGYILELITEENRRAMTLNERVTFLVDSNHMFGTEYSDEYASW